MMIRTLIPLSLVLMLALSGFAGAAPAQQRLTNSYLEELRQQVESQHQAYLRLDLAEREAMEDGASDQAATYKAAKIKAYESYNTLNAKLQKAQNDKREQDRRLEAQNQNPDYR